MISVEYVRKVFEKSVPSVLHKEDDKASSGKLCKLALEQKLNKVCVKSELFDFTLNLMDKKSVDVMVLLESSSIPFLQKQILKYKDIKIKNIFVFLDVSDFRLSYIDEIFSDLKGMIAFEKIVFCVRDTWFKTVEQVKELLEKLKVSKIKKINLINSQKDFLPSAYNFLKGAKDSDMEYVLYFSPLNYDFCELICRIAESDRVADETQKYWFIIPLALMINKNLSIIENS